MNGVDQLMLAIMAAILGRPRPEIRTGTISRRRNPRNPPDRSQRSLRREAARAAAEAKAREILKRGIPLKHMHAHARRRAEKQRASP
jgi:hypothetical protein